MKSKSCFFIFCAIFLTNCTSQTSFLSISNAVKGNTGHRGIMPKDEEYKPIQGNDYYNLQLTVGESCSLEILSLTVKADGGQVNLLPKFDNNQVKRKVKKGEMIYLNVEKNKELTVAKPSINGEGSLLVKINGKETRIAIKEFKLILPQ